jgi:hypothetical protein
VREVSQHETGDLERAIAVVDGEHEHLRVLGTRGFEQVEPRGIAVVHAEGPLPAEGGPMDRERAGSRRAPRVHS